MANVAKVPQEKASDAPSMQKEVDDDWEQTQNLMRDIFGGSDATADTALFQTPLKNAPFNFSASNKVQPTSGSYMQDLHTRLDEAEDLFLFGRYDSALDGAQSVLRDLVTIAGASRPPVVGKKQSGFSLTQHECKIGCVCKAAFALCMQSMYEGGRVSQLHLLVEEYYGSATSMPYSVFVLWTQCMLAAKQFNIATKALSGYLLEHQAPREGARDPEKKYLTIEEYDGLVELIVFHGLLPLGRIKEAKKFVSENQLLSPWRQKAYLRNLNRLDNFFVEGKPAPLLPGDVPPSTTDSSSIEATSATTSDLKDAEKQTSNTVGHQDHPVVPKRNGPVITRTLFLLALRRLFTMIAAMFVIYKAFAVRKRLPFYGVFRRQFEEFIKVLRSSTFGRMF